MNTNMTGFTCMVFKSLSILVLWTKVAAALEGLKANKIICETLAYGYSTESTQRELSNEYQHDRFYMLSFQKSFHPSALDESSLNTRGLKANKII